MEIPGADAPSRFKIFKSRREIPENAMQRAKKKEEEKATKSKDDSEKSETKKDDQ